MNELANNTLSTEDGPSAEVLANEKLATGFFSLESLGRAFSTSSFSQAELVGHLITDIRSLDYKARQGAARLLWQMSKDILVSNGRIATARQTRTTTENGSQTKVSVTSFSLLERLKEIGEPTNGSSPNPHRVLSARNQRDSLGDLDVSLEEPVRDGPEPLPLPLDGATPDGGKGIPLDPEPRFQGSTEPDIIQPARPLDP